MSVFSAGLLLHCLIDIVYASIPGPISCSNQTDCRQQLGENSECSVAGSSLNGTCVCDTFYYLQDNPRLSCDECPGIGDSCAVSQCCNEDYLVCHGDVCMCIYSEYCWSIGESERVRFQRVAQCILAVALVLTGTILFILFWKSCTRRSVVRRHLRNMSADSFLSLNSIQRLVLLQLQDCPPPYNPDTFQPWKNMGEMVEPPPSYIEAVGVPNSPPQGEDNVVFVLGEFPLITSRDQQNGNRVLMPLQNNLPASYAGSLQNPASLPNSATTLSQSSSPSTNSIPISVPDGCVLTLLQNSSQLDNTVSIPRANDSQETSVAISHTELHI